MWTALSKTAKGEKGSPIPWAEPEAAPWFDQEWSQGEAELEDEELRALGARAEESGFEGVSAGLAARTAFSGAVKATRLRIR